MYLDQSQLSSIVLIGSSIFTAFLVALWIVLVFWTYRDIRSRSRDKLVPILACLLVLLLFLPGWILYFFLRPQKTLEEKYRQALEEETLLQTIEEYRLCPGCERQIEADWKICPSCQTILRKTCSECGRVIEQNWDVCPYCAAPIPGMRRASQPGINEDMEKSNN